MSLWNRIRNSFRRKDSSKPNRVRPNEPERAGPNEKGKKLLWCPFAIIDPKYKMKTAGKYRRGYPEGLVVHFTAGSSAESSLMWGKEQGFAFWMIAKNGDLYQTKPLDLWGYHAGKSSWPGISGTVSDEFDGVEIDCAGRLEKKGNNWQSWFGRVVPASLRRYSKGEANIVEGWYEKFTPEQEATLKRLALWLKENCPEVFDLDKVVGHDECSEGRKNDPGAALSMTMPEFREMIKKEYKP